MAEEDEDIDSKIRKMAEDHAEYTIRVMRVLYVETFIHGVKHGMELRKDG